MIELLGPALFFGAGLFGGFASSTPLGPINMWVVDRRLHARPVRSFLAGVISADLVSATLAAWGYYSFLDDGWIPPGLLTALLGVVLIALGFGNLWRLRRPAGPPPALSRTAARRMGDYGMGVLMCGANPAFLAFWVFVFNLLGEGLELNSSPVRMVLFLLGVTCGDALWFGLLSWLTRRGARNLHPGLLRGIRQAIALGFVLLGGVGLWWALEEFVAHGV